eukprot:6200441-Pleurochrysis_carterae.AAC.3
MAAVVRMVWSLRLEHFAISSPDAATLRDRQQASYSAGAGLLVWWLCARSRECDLCTLASCRCVHDRSTVMQVQHILPRRSEEVRCTIVLARALWQATTLLGCGVVGRVAAAAAAVGVDLREAA